MNVYPTKSVGCMIPNALPVSPAPPSVVNACVCEPAEFREIPVYPVLMVDHVRVPAESAAKLGGFPPLLLKSSLTVVCVCV